MNLRLNRLTLALASVTSVTLLTLSACGGGGGGVQAVDTPAASLEGVVATGAAVANALVAVTDGDGVVACGTETVQANEAGAYSCSLKPGAAAPFVIVATDPTGVADPLVSLVGETPAAGSKTNANVTPLTNAIAAMLAPNRNPLMLVPAAGTGATDRAARKAALTAAGGNLVGQVRALVTQLKDVLTQAGITDLEGFNPISTPFVARSSAGKGGPGDVLLDIVRVEVAAAADGSPALAMSNRFGTAPPVLIAAAGTAAPPAITATVGGFAIGELDFARAEFEKCFAVPSATRVRSSTLSNTNGFKQVNSTDPACEGFTSDSAKTGAGTNFKNNGYNGGEYFYGMLTNPDMDGAKFNLPELMRYITRSDGKDEAVLNIKFRDKNGNVFNRILLAKKFPGSDVSSGRTAGTDWWLYGNQRPVDASIQAVTRRNLQAAPNAGVSGTFVNRDFSNYESGFNIFIDRFGPGSTNLRYMRVTGPGLPTNGLVYAQQSPSCGASSVTWMSVLNKTGTIPLGTAQTSNEGNLFRIQRARLDGSAYSMPNQSVAAPTGQQIRQTYAHPADYAKTVPSGNFIDFSTLPAWTSYNFELFYNTETTASVTFTASIVTPVQVAAAGLSQQWQDWSADSLQYLDPASARGGSQTQLDLSWTRNTYAERITSLGVYSGTNPGGVYTPVDQAVTNVGIGQTAVTVTAPSGAGCSGGAQFPALTADAQSNRNFQFRYQRLDGSTKTSFHRYN